MTRSSIVVTAFSAFAFLSTGAARLAHAETKLAYVDLQRALEETEDGKAAKAKLKKEFDKKQKELDEKQEELKKIKDDLDKKLPLMKPEAQAAEQKKFQDRFVELQQTYARLQQDLAKKEQTETSSIFAKLQRVVAQIAEREKVSLVLEKNSAIVWGQPSLDITNEVIRAYNAASGGGKK
jgi:outer membrane protein